MKILIDTREQNPLDFNHEFVTEIKTMKLDVGDYAVEFANGYVPPVRFERKNLTDLFGTLGKGYDRFKREIERAKVSDTKLILIVEGSLGKVLKGTDFSHRDGFAIVKQMFTIWVRYGVLPVFCKDREECSRYILEYFLAVGRNMDFGKS